MSRWSKDQIISTLSQRRPGSRSHRPQPKWKRFWVFLRQHVPAYQDGFEMRDAERLKDLYHEWLTIENKLPTLHASSGDGPVLNRRAIGRYDALRNDYLQSAGLPGNEETEPKKR